MISTKTKKKFSKAQFLENINLKNLLTIKRTRKNASKRALAEARRKKRQALVYAIRLQNDGNVEEAFEILGEEYTPEIENALRLIDNGKLYLKLQQEIMKKYANIFTTEVSLAIQVLLGISDSKYDLLRKFLRKFFDWDTKTYTERKLDTLPVPSFLKALPKIQQKKKEIENMIHRDHNDVAYVYNLEDYIKALLESPGLKDTYDVSNNKLQLKYSMDGTPLTKNKLLVVGSFCILNQGRLINSTYHNYTQAVYLMEEKTEDIHTHMNSTMAIIDNLLKKGITIQNGKEEKHLGVEFYFTGDYMFARAFLGFPKAFNEKPCIYCDVSLSEMGDFEKVNEPHDLKLAHKIVDCTQVKFIPDTLHLTMRLTANIFERTLEKIELSDTNSGTMRSQLYSNMAKYGIHKKEKENNTTSTTSTTGTTFLGRECWALMFNIRNILESFKNIEDYDNILLLWELQRKLLSNISRFGGKWKYDNIAEFKEDMGKWKSIYIKLFGNLVKAPYIHIFAVHIIGFLEQYGALGKFSMQAIENKNKKIKQTYKKSNYKLNNSNDWRNQILRLDWLRLKLIFGNKATCIRPHMPYISKKKETIITR